MFYILFAPETSIAGQWRKTRLVETINQNLINLRFVFIINNVVILFCCVGHVAREMQLRRTLSRI